MTQDPAPLNEFNQPDTFGYRFLKERARLRARGLSITRREGEYRVAFFQEPETAYFTNDFDDAIATGHAMAQRREDWEYENAARDFATRNGYASGW